MNINFGQLPQLKADGESGSYNFIADMDELLIGVGSGVLMGPTNVKNHAYVSNASLAVSENCFSTYNTPKFKQGYEAFP